MAMGGDVGGGNLETLHPVRQHQRHCVVLGGGVTAVSAGLIFTVHRCFEAEMQGEVVDRATHLGIGDHPDPVEGGIAGTEGPLHRVDHLDDLTALTDQGVIADLVVIIGVGGDEGVDR